jgi:hypothetical protein
MAEDQDQDNPLPRAAELLFEQWRKSELGSDTSSRVENHVLEMLRSHGVRDSHETLVDTALLAPPVPMLAGEGYRPRVTPLDGLPERLPVALQAGRRRVTAALSGLTVALALALGLWMASLQVASGALVRSSVAAPVRDQAKAPPYEPDRAYGRSDGWHRPEFPGADSNGRDLSAPGNKKPASGHSPR